MAYFRAEKEAEIEVKKIMLDTLVKHERRVKPLLAEIQSQITQLKVEIQKIETDIKE